MVLTEQAKQQLQITHKIKQKLERNPKEKWGTVAVLKHHAAIKADPTVLKTLPQEPESASESDFDLTPRRDADFQEVKENVSELKQQIQELRVFVMNEIKAIKAAPPKIIEVASKPSILEVAFPTIDRSHTELITTKPVQQVKADQA